MRITWPTSIDRHPLTHLRTITLSIIEGHLGHYNVYQLNKNVRWTGAATRWADKELLGQGNNTGIQVFP